MSNEEREMWETQIRLLKEIKEELMKLNDDYEIEDETITNYIETHQEEIYNAYCESHPENITSNTEYEDIPDDFIVEYAMNKLGE